MVISGDPELSVALRDRIDRVYATVVEVTPAEALEAVRGCAPWPWMVVGDTAEIAPAAARELARVPALVAWRDPRPPALPAHTVIVAGFRRLAEEVELALHAELHGMTLAPGDGVVLRDGRHVVSAALEALVASRGRPLFAPLRRFAGAARALAAHNVPLRPGNGSAGGVVLRGADSA